MVKLMGPLAAKKPELGNSPCGSMESIRSPVPSMPKMQGHALCFCKFKTFGVGNGDHAIRSIEGQGLAGHKVAVGGGGDTPNWYHDW